MPLVGAAAAAGVLDEVVHRAAVERQLLGAVVVVVVAGDGLGAIQPARLAAEFGLSVEQRPASDRRPRPSRRCR